MKGILHRIRGSSRCRRRFAGWFVLLALLAGCRSAGDESVAEGTKLVVATLNIHYVAAEGNSQAGERMAWERRKEAVLAAVRDMNADILAFQEMETFAGGHYNDTNRQLEFLRDRTSGYEFAAVGDPAVYPSTQPIMYRGDRFTFIEQGFFFFSETPDEIYSSSWDGRFPAYCSWARFRDRSSGTTFSVYNVHFDAASRRNRLLSADLVAARVSNREHPEEPVLVVGDFNAPWFFPAVARVADAGLRIANTTGSTYHFYRGIRILPAIDHVLHSPTLEHDSTEVLRRRYDGVWPSDHFPVVVSLVIPSSGGRTRRRSSVVGRPLHERGIAVRFADDGK